MTRASDGKTLAAEAFKLNGKAKDVRLLFVARGS